MASVPVGPGVRFRLGVGNWKGQARLPDALGAWSYAVSGTGGDGFSDHEPCWRGGASPMVELPHRIGASRDE